MYLGGFLATSALGTIVVPGDSSLNPIPLSIVAIDDLGIWPGGTPTTITIPAGVGHIRVYVQAILNVPSSALATQGEIRCRVYKNGAVPNPVQGIGQVIQPNVTLGNHLTQQSGLTTILPATPGDTWGLIAQNFTGQSVTASEYVLGLEFYN